MNLIADRGEARRLIFFVLIGALVAAALIAITGVLVGSLGTAAARALTTCGAIIAYGVLGLASTMGRRERGFAPLAAINGVLATLGVLSALILIWVDTTSVTVWKAQVCLFIATFAAAHACFMLGRRRPTDGALVARTVDATIVLIAVVAGLLDLTILVNGEIGAGVWRLLLIAIVLDVTCNLLVPLLRRTQRGQPAHPPLPAPLTGDTAGFCAECGSALPPMARFCPVCGTPRQPVLTPAGTEPWSGFAGALSRPAASAEG